MCDIVVSNNSVMLLNIEKIQQIKRIFASERLVVDEQEVLPTIIEFEMSGDGVVLDLLNPLFEKGKYFDVFVEYSDHSLNKVGDRNGNNYSNVSYGRQDIKISYPSKTKTISFTNLSYQNKSLVKFEMLKILIHETTVNFYFDKELVGSVLRLSKKLISEHMYYSDYKEYTVNDKNGMGIASVPILELLSNEYEITNWVAQIVKMDKTFDLQSFNEFALSNDFVDIGGKEEDQGFVLHITVTKRGTLEISSFTLDKKGNLEIQIEDHICAIEKLFFKPRSKKYNENLQSVAFQGCYNKNLGSFVFEKKDINKFLFNAKIRINYFDMFALIKTETGAIIFVRPIVRIPNEISYQGELESEGLVLKPFITKVSSLALRVDITGKFFEQVTQKQTSLSILGSCYSRLAFTSTDFFNLDYKKTFKVDYTQFH